MNVEDKKETCRNCGTSLEGEFCHHCGQSATVVRRPAKELFEDAFGYVLQWDNRLFHTLGHLFFKPGQLSLDWVNGKRMRYVPPFRLYIIASFILFLLVGFATRSGVIEVENAEIETTKVTEKLREAEVSARENGEWFSAVLLNAVSEAVEDPSGYLQKIISNLPKAAFLFLPIFGLIHMATEIRKDRYYIDYLVFSLHFHAFAFSLLAFILLLGFISEPLGNVAQLLNFAVPVYAIVGIRKFNHQSWLKSSLKGFLIFGAYNFIMGIGIVFFFGILLFI